LEYGFLQERSIPQGPLRALLPGIRMTDVLNSLEQAYVPADPRPKSKMPTDGTGSFKRWAGLEGPNKRPFDDNTKRYIGPTLMTLRVLAQNRRSDGEPQSHDEIKLIVTTHAAYRTCDHH
jgi:hypothetical protein